MTTSTDLYDRIAGRNLAQRFLSNVEKHGDVEVVNWKTDSGDWASLTLNDLADHTARLVTALKNLGVGKGDTVVLMMRNRQEFHAIDLAVLFCGATPVSIYN
ncbi:AMP-binding protein, partial [Ilumatobacter sp.]|uniref:AMP-binding protein n=1 Tax=Ilumatobacter sp. TaxID=1967498 RepID=UPI003C4CE9AD